MGSYVRQALEKNGMLECSSLAITDCDRLEVGITLKAFEITFISFAGGRQGASQANCYPRRRYGWTARRNEDYKRSGGSPLFSIWNWSFFPCLRKINFLSSSWLTWLRSFCAKHIGQEALSNGFGQLSHPMLLPVKRVHVAGLLWKLSVMFSLVFLVFFSLRVVSR